MVAAPAIRLHPPHHGEAAAQQADLFGRRRGRQPFVAANGQHVVCAIKGDGRAAFAHSACCWACARAAQRRQIII